jgi:hypothetical protein
MHARTTAFATPRAATAFSDGQWRLWFCGNGFGTVGYATGIFDTALNMAWRSADSPEVDANWGPWQSLWTGDTVQARRYLQLHASLSTRDPRLSPALCDVSIGAGTE